MTMNGEMCTVYRTQQISEDDKKWDFCVCHILCGYNWMAAGMKSVDSSSVLLCDLLPESAFGIIPNVRIYRNGLHDSFVSRK